MAGIPFSLAGIFFAKELLGLMGADAWSLEHGYRYLVWMLGGNVVIMLIFVINAVFRGASGVFWAILFAESRAGLVGIWRFRRGGWKRVRV